VISAKKINWAGLELRILNGNVKITPTQFPDDAREPNGGVPSPCVRNCCLDENDICLGCFRSISEILRWSEATEEEKRAILARSRLRSEGARNQKGGQARSIS